VGPRLESVRRAPDEGKQWAAIAWVLGELGARCVAAADRQFLANEPFVVVHGTVRLDGAPEHCRDVRQRRRASASLTSDPAPASTAFVAALRVGPSGHELGIDMTLEMLDKAQATAGQLGLDHIDFREASSMRSRSRTAGPTS
jgi:hypothetical protein